MNTGSSLFRLWSYLNNTCILFCFAHIRFSDCTTYCNPPTLAEVVVDGGGDPIPLPAEMSFSLQRGIENFNQFVGCTNIILNPDLR